MKKTKKPRLLIVSLDAVSSSDLELLQTLPNFKKLLKTGTLVKNVESIFVSNTYPIHTSMISGVLPKDHGIIDNTFFDYGNTKPLWRWHYSLINSQTVVDIAVREHYRIASIFWPVLAQAPIKYNLPEIVVGDHESQIYIVLKNSTKLFALSRFIKYFKVVDGSKQPNLDDFSTLVAGDLLRKMKVDLLFLHLTDTDSQKHYHGVNSPEAHASLMRMDERLGSLMSATDDNYQILIVSDHSQADADNHIDLNQDNPFKDTWWHQCEGSALLLEKELVADQTLMEIKDWISKQPCFRRFLTAKEMQDSGFSTVSRLALAADYNWSLCAKENNHVGNHGYPLDMPDYQPFYFVKGTGLPANLVIEGGKIYDVCPLMLQLLNLPKFPNLGTIPSPLVKKSNS